MTIKHRVMVYGRRHIHDHMRTLAEWQAKRKPGHTISQEYDNVLQAGIKALYGQEIPMDLPEKQPEPATPPAMEVQANV